MKRLLLTITAVLMFASPVGAVTRHAPRNPVMALSAPVRATFTCIIWRESRSTWGDLNLGDNNRYGSSGIFQIEPILWNRWAPMVGVRVPVWQANVYQQELVAVNIHRYDGFSPWRYDGCM